VCKDFKTNNTYEYVDHMLSHPKLDDLSLKTDLNEMKKKTGICKYCNKNIKEYYSYQKHIKTGCIRKKTLDYLDNLDTKEEIHEFMNILATKFNTSQEIDEIISILTKKRKLIEHHNPDKSTTYNTAISGAVNLVNSTVSGSVNNNNNNISNNISLNNLRKENLDMLNEYKNVKFQNNLFDSLGEFKESRVDAFVEFDREKIKNAMVMLFEEVYFNKEYPENHNIYVTSKAYDRPFHVYINDVWEKTGDLKTIADIIIRVKQIFKEWIKQNLKNTIDEFIKEGNQEEANYYKKYLNVLFEDLERLCECIAKKMFNVTSVREITKLFHDTAYKHRRTVEPTFKDTVISPNRKKKLILTKKDARPHKTKLRIKGMY
jgi:hypothetical protein